MTKIINLFEKEKFVMFDGGFGTELIARGIDLSDTPPEYLNIQNPNIVKEIHKAYYDAGSMFVTTNTFGANRYKLSHYGMETKVREFCLAGVKIAREASNSKKYVAGSIGPIGKLIEPLGELTFDEAYEIYSEVARSFDEAKPDVIIIETMIDIQEARIAALAVKDNTDIPFIVSMTYENGKRTPTGTSPDAAAVTLQDLGAIAIGANCSSGPEDMSNVVEKIRSVSDLPIIIEANAGTPIQDRGKTVFPMDAENYCKHVKNIYKAGANIIGGCCGTTPSHIKTMRLELEKCSLEKSCDESNKKSFLSSRTAVVEVDRYPIIIGERINPNARKVIAKSIKDKNFSVILDEAQIQVSAGAHVLDVNVSAVNVDEPEVMKTVVKDLTSVVNVPLCLDSPSHIALEEGLKYFPGKALVNSTNGEQERLDKVLPLVKKYGASLVCLTMDENGIPSDVDGRIKIAEKIIKECDKYGIPRRDLYFDTLTLAVATETDSVVKTLEALKFLKEKYFVRTVLGVSNVGFGLPRRDALTSSFLAMAIYNGLDAAIINPNNDSVRNTFYAAALLANRDVRAKNYLESVSDDKDVKNEKKEQNISLYDVILRGNKQGVIENTNKELSSKKPIEIVNQIIIPALEEVGKLYETGKYFLPQLLFSAEAAQECTKYLEAKMLELGEKQEKPRAVIVFATVRGDLHDIGKNIVIAVLKNYGYKIIDLGKNIDAKTIVDAAEEHNADLICLSALMTTTMTEMKLVVDTLIEKNIRDKYKVTIGGAVVNQEYSDTIKADGYASDAISTIHLLKKLGF